MTDHGTGWVPERVHRRAAGRVGTVLRRRVGALPDSGGVAREPWDPEQGDRNACTTHFGANAIYGLTGVKTSPWFGWTFGRVRDGGKIGELENVGLRTSSMEAALRKHGACLYDVWHPGIAGFDYDALPPGWTRAVAQRHNLTLRPLYASGGKLVDLLIGALATGRPVGIVVRVDRTFDRAGADPVGPESGTSRGLHIITGWRFYRSGGAWVVECLPHWGPDFADEGIVRLSAERIAQSPYACIAESVS